MTLFIEGGCRVHSSFIQEGLADELYFIYGAKTHRKRCFFIHE
ncbi:hypothetical protein [Sporosarcina sp. LAM9210]